MPAITTIQVGKSFPVGGITGMGVGDGAIVGASVGVAVGRSVGVTVVPGTVVGVGDGFSVGEGFMVGVGVEVGDGLAVGTKVAEGVAENAGKLLSPIAKRVNVRVTFFTTPFITAEMDIVCSPGSISLGPLPKKSPFPPPVTFWVIICW